MLKILIVEDEDATQLILKKHISSAHECEFRSAKNGLDGLEELRSFRPDIVLLDIMMPVMSGIDFLQKVSSDTEFNSTPILVLTAVSESETVRKILSMGVTEFIIKPFDRESLLQRLNRVIERIQQGRIRRTSESGAYSQESLLIIDKHTLYREKLKKFFSNTMATEDADSTLTGAKMFNEKPYTILLISESISLMNETFFARKIRSSQSGKDCLIYLLADNPQRYKAGELPYFDGVQKRWLDPHQTASEFLKIVQEKRSTSSS